MRGTEPPPKKGTLMLLETKGVKEFSTVHTQQTKQRTEWSLPQKSDGKDSEKIILCRKIHGGSTRCTRRVFHL